MRGKAGSMLFLVAFICFTGMSGCGPAQESLQESELTQEEEEKAIQEEEEAFESMKMGISHKQAAKILLDTGCYKQSGQGDQKVMVSDSGEITVPIGDGGTEDVREIGFYIHSTSEPTKDETIKGELFSGIKAVLDAMGEEYSDEKIIRKMESLKEREQIDEFSYSEKICFFFARGGKGDKTGFNVRIFARQQGEWTLAGRDACGSFSHIFETFFYSVSYIFM